MNITCIIVDDDQNCIDGLLYFLSHFQSIEVKATFTDPVAALSFLVRNRVELLLLDIDMPSINGIELAKSIRERVNKLVYTTGHTKYAFEAFENQADGYLLKPFTLIKMLSTLHRIFPLQNDPVTSITALDEGFIFVKAKLGSKLVKVKLNELVVIESKNNYIELQTVDQQITTYMTLSEVAKKLIKQPDFIQIQRSFIINKNHIEYIEGNIVVMTSGVKITVGEMFRATFQAFLDERIIKMGKKS